MYIHDLSPVAGSTHVDKRKGRGHATGNGKTAGRGHKGQKARSGGGVRIGFEGGQMPLARRIPKRGFNNIFAKPLEALNVDVLNKFEDGAVVDAQALLDAGILSKCKYGVKFLGNGEVTKNLTVKAAAFSETAEGHGAGSQVDDAVIYAAAAELAAVQDITDILLVFRKHIQSEGFLPWLKRQLSVTRSVPFPFECTEPPSKTKGLASKQSKPAFSQKAFAIALSRSQ